MKWVEVGEVGAAAAAAAIRWPQVPSSWRHFQSRKEPIADWWRVTVPACERRSS